MAISNSPYRRITDQNNDQVLESQSQLPFLKTGFLAGAAGLHFSRKTTTSPLAYLSPDRAYSGLRNLESNLPVFRIPLRVAQLGDMFSPFASGKELGFAYSGSELIGNRLTKNLSQEFVDTLIASGAETLSRQGSTVYSEAAVKDLIQKHGIEFRKTGAVYGDIYLKDTKRSLVKNVFLSEVSSSTTSEFGAIWESGKRLVIPHKALSTNSAFATIASNITGGRLSRADAAKLGGFLKGHVGGLAREYAIAMNRFLKEPIPGLSRLLGTKIPVSDIKRDPSDLFGKFLGESFGSKFQKPDDLIKPFGKINQHLRPYVSDITQKSTGRILGEIAARGSVYTIGLPGAYLGLSALRRKFDDPGSSIVSTPLFTAIGAGIGGFAMPYTKKTTLPYLRQMGFSRSMVAGAAAGAIVGAFPAFDKGLSAGFGSLYSNFRIGMSSVWDIVGGSKTVQRQEELFPGLTSPATGVGFLMTGGILGFINKELGTIKGNLSPFRKKAYSNIHENINKIISNIQAGKNIDASAVESVFKSFSKVETPGYIGATKEVRNILTNQAFKTTDIHSRAGFLAKIFQENLSYQLKNSVEGSEEFKRLMTQKDRLFGTKSSLSQFASTVYHSGEDFVRYLAGQKTEESLLNSLSRYPKLSAFRNRVKDLFFAKEAGFARGAVRGGALFTGLSFLGAAATSVMEGDFNPLHMIPGWMIKLTGGGESGEETRKVFTGEKEVAINKARWWFLGRTPFEGEKIQYFRKHRAVLAQTDASDNALYGSFDERVAYEPILHPIRALFDDDFKYHRERKLQYVSPTPLTGRMFTDVPLFGDVLGSTLGQLIKPTRAIRPSEWMISAASGGAGVFGQVPVKSPPGRLTQGPFNQYPVDPTLGGDVSFNALSPHSVYNQSKKFGSRFVDQAGLKGFLFRSFVENFGYRERVYEPMLESAESLFGASRSYWSLGLGDPGGVTEAIRRFLPQDKSNYYNPLTNIAPSWLPSSSAEFYKDFKHGNYFNKVNEGEIRLPGAGYETLFPALKGLEPERYPIAYKYKILSDVAYMSDQWKHMKRRVINSIQAGSLTPDELKIVEETNRQLEQRSKKKPTRNYQFRSSNIVTRNLTVSAVLRDGTIAFQEFGDKAFKSAGADYSFAALSRQALTNENLRNIDKANAKAEENQQNIRNYLLKRFKPGTEVTVSITKNPFDSDVGEFYVKGLSKKLLSLGAEATSSQDFASIKYNKAQRFLGKAWETFTHNADIPLTPAMLFNNILPLQPQAKFIQRLSPVELYARTKVYGRDIQMWQRFKEDFLDTAINETVARVGGDFIPQRVEKQREIQEYYDKLKWFKFFNLEQQAMKQGNSVLAEAYKKKKRETAFGVDPYRGYKHIYNALARSEREFYRNFIDERDPAERKRILSLIPEYSKHIFISQWEEKDARTVRAKIEAGSATAEDRNFLREIQKNRQYEGMNVNRELLAQYRSEVKSGGTVGYADWMRGKMLEKYFKHYKLPSKNFVGFNPNVDLEDVKLKMVQAEGMDIHDFNLWESREQNITQMPYIDRAVDQLGDWKRANLSEVEIRNMINTIFKGQYSSVNMTRGGPGQENKVVFVTDQTRHNEVKSIYNGYGIF